jgi:hypothetical protein
MTLVFHRPTAVPATHAFVIGCGRFSHLTAADNRPATAAGARAMIEFLTKSETKLIAPLASIECLLSDPAVAAGSDQVQLASSIDQNGNQVPSPKLSVDCANLNNARTAGLNWLARCRPGDHMFFYMASHGIADGPGRAFGLLEDVNSNQYNPFAESVNIGAMAIGLPTIGAGACWIFLDACQEIPSIEMTGINGADGLILVNPSSISLAKAGNVPCCAVAGSRYGGYAEAPGTAQPPFFTQALLRGLGGACIDDLGANWVVTAKSITWDLPAVAEVALGYNGLPATPLTPYNQDIALLQVNDPFVTVAVHTKIQSDMLRATKVSATDQNGTIRIKSDNNPIWRFDVPPSYLIFTVIANFPPNGPTYPSKTFRARPPVQDVLLQ